MSQRSAAGDALTALVLKVFRLNGQLLDIADRITEGTALTAARWQVLGAVLSGGLSVAEIGRTMGLTRQSVQRLADALVEDGLCEFLENPAHKRAKLLSPTARGFAAIDVIRPIQHSWANRVAADVGLAKLREVLAAIDALLAALDHPANQPEHELSGDGAGNQRAGAGTGRGSPGRAKGRTDPSGRSGTPRRPRGASR